MNSKTILAIISTALFFTSTEAVKKPQVSIQCYKDIALTKANNKTALTYWGDYLLALCDHYITENKTFEHEVCCLQLELKDPETKETKYGFIPLTAWNNLTLQEKLDYTGSIRKKHWTHISLPNLPNIKTTAPRKSKLRNIKITDQSKDDILKTRPKETDERIKTVANVFNCAYIIYS